MQIDFNPKTKTYTFEGVTETEIQIFNRAFEYDRPFCDIPELDIYSRDIQRQLGDVTDELIARYRG